MNTTPATILTNGSTTTVSNRFLTVREDGVTFPNGANGTYNVVTSGNGLGTATLPVHLDADGRWQVALVGQHRYPLDRIMHEIPRGGASELTHDEAARELNEETGLSNLPLIFLGHLTPDSGLLNTTVATYAVVTDGPVELTSEPGCTTQWVAWADYISQVRSGAVLADTFTLSAMALWMSSPEAIKMVTDRAIRAALKAV